MSFLSDLLNLGSSVLMLVPGVGWAVKAGILIGNALLQQALAPHPTKDPLVGREDNVTSTVGALPVVYGRAKVGGHVVYLHANGPTLWMVVALCHGPIQAIDEIFLDGNLAVSAAGVVRSHAGLAKTITGLSSDYPATVATGNVTPGDPGATLVAHDLQPGDTVTILNDPAAADFATMQPIAGDWVVQTIPTTSTFTIPTTGIAGFGWPGPSSLHVQRQNPGYAADTAHPSGFIQFAKYLGSDTQNTTTAAGVANGPTADSTLKGSDLTAVMGTWDANHKGGGVAYLILKLAYDANKFQAIPKVTAIVRGRTLFDPRDGTTAYSTNPALAVRDYLTNTRYGRGIASAKMQDGSDNVTPNTFRCEAAFADAQVDVPASTGMHTITSSNAATDRFTSTPHFLVATNRVWIRGHTGSVPAIPDGLYTIKSVPTSLTFTLDDGAGGTLNITTGGTGGTVQKVVTQKRFELNGVVDTARSLGENLTMLRTASRAQLSFEGGTYRLFTRRPVTVATFELNDDTIIGDWSFNLPGVRDVPNTLRCTFLNSLANWQPEVFDWPLPGMTNTYLTNDNSVRVQREIELPFTISRYMAEQIAMVALEEMRAGLTVSLVASEGAMALSVGDLVNVTLRTPGWGPSEAAPATAKKLFWVMGMGILPNATVAIALMEYRATCYDMQLTDDADASVETGLAVPWFVAAPTVPAVGLEMLASGTRDARFRVSWTASASAIAARYELQAQRTAPLSLADADFREYGYVSADQTYGFVGPIADGEEWVVRVRALTSVGVASEWLTSSATTASVPASATCTAVATAQADGVSYAITYGADCAEVRIYTTQNAATGGANPSETAQFLVGPMPRPGSGIWTQRVATTPGYYRRTLIVPFDASGVRGVALAIIETHAVNAGAAPGQPGALTQSASTDESIGMTWTAGSGTPDHYNIYVDGVIVHTVGALLLATVHGLVASSSYLVQVSAVKSGVEGTKSTAVYMTTAAPATAPTTLTEVSCSTVMYGVKTYVERVIGLSGGAGGAWELFESVTNVAGTGFVVGSAASASDTITLSRLSTYTGTTYLFARYTGGDWSPVLTEVWAGGGC